MITRDQHLQNGCGNIGTFAGFDAAGGVGPSRLSVVVSPWGDGEGRPQGGDEGVGAREEKDISMEEEEVSQKGRTSRTLKEPWMPTQEEVGGRGTGWPPQGPPARYILRPALRRIHAG